jgi:hypothetical protein
MKGKKKTEMTKGEQNRRESNKHTVQIVFRSCCNVNNGRKRYKVFAFTKAEKVHRIMKMRSYNRFCDTKRSDVNFPTSPKTTPSQKR